MGPYKVYQVVDEGQGTGDTHGQCWTGETVAENIELCQHQTILPALVKYLPREGRILESGCGLGRWVFYLRERGYDIVGIDLAEPAVELAMAHDPTAPIYLDDVLGSRFPDKSFSAAISLGVVEHFETGPQEALAELCRLLEDNGLLFISVPVQNVIRRLLVNRLKDSYRWLRGRMGTEFLFEEYRYTVAEFSAHLDAAGFDRLEVIADDFLPPRNLGLYSDFRILHGGRGKWELNPVGRAVRSVLFALSPWTICAGAFWVCRKR